MKALLENKLVLHIVGEAIVFIAVIFYFSQRNKRIMNHINDLVQRLEEQEDTIHKHEKAIEALTKQLNEFKQLITKPEVSEAKKVTVTNTKPRVVEEIKNTKLPIFVSVAPSVIVEPVKQDSRVTELSTVEEIDDEENEVQEEDDEELDKELENELKELERSNYIQNIN